MARASTVTLLSLDRFARVMGQHPLHFNQVYTESAPATICSDPVLQYAWQAADRVGREEIAEAIATAEDQISRYLGYKLLPTWIAGEPHELLRFGGGGSAFARLADARGRGLPVQTDYGYIVEAGQRGSSLIDADAAITYSDVDGDGYDETATITVSTTVTDVNEVRIFYPGESGVEEWEIRPITVSIVNGNATITCKRQQLVKPELMDGFSVEGVDGDVDANFLTTVDVYRIYNDPSLQIRYEWEGWDGGCSTCVACRINYQTGCVTIRDARLGIVHGRPANWNADDSQFDTAELNLCAWPERVKLWYRAGARDERLTRSMVEMKAEWERIIAYYAVTLLDRPWCSCDAAANYSKYWRTDLARNDSGPSGSTNFAVGSQVLDNPLGTTRGAVQAWNAIQRLRIGEGVRNA